MIATAPIELTTEEPLVGGKASVWAHVDEEGRLVLPPEVAARLGLVPGAQVRLEETKNGLKLHRPITHLAKVYIEPTDACNIACRTCFRNDWDVPMGRMSEETFAAILRGLEACDPIPTVYFGGIGEPLFHKRTTAWVAQAKALGARVELITNGTLLTEKRSRELIEAGLDMLWVSIDGASPESYADIRLGAELPNVLANLERFHRLRMTMHTGTFWHRPKPALGIAFVAMKRNIRDLPAVLRLAQRFGALHVSVSNVLPVTPDLEQEILYRHTLRAVNYWHSEQIPEVSLPKMDFNEETRDVLYQVFNSGFSVTFAGNEWGSNNDVCGYIESGSMTIAWNGDVSPCWPLMHTHVGYLRGRRRVSYRHVIGNVRERSLLDLWFDPEYMAYRRRVQSFAFAPCTTCGGCDLILTNEEDCLGNEYPVCGACLWAQGIVQCP